MNSQKNKSLYSKEVDEIIKKNNDKLGGSHDTQGEDVHNKIERSFFKLLILSFRSPIKAYNKVLIAPKSVIIKNWVFFFLITLALSYLSAVALMDSSLIKESQFYDYFLTIPVLLPFALLIPAAFFHLISRSMNINQPFLPYAKLVFWSVSPLLLFMLLTSFSAGLIDSFFSVSVSIDLVPKLMLIPLIIYFVISLSVSQKITLTRSSFIYLVGSTSISLLYLLLRK